MFSWSPSTSSTTLQSIKSLSPSNSSFGRLLLENLTRSPLYHSLTSLDKTKLWSKFYVDEEENVQKVLDAVSVDQKVITNPRANRRRRTVMVTRNNGQPFGFTLQTYLLKKKGDNVPSKVTYVDYVQLDSPAADAGIRAGDVIISINGDIVTEMSHEALIKLINSCHQMRMVVIFENIRQRIELVARAIKLRKILNDKLYQLNLIDIEEQKILNRAYLRSVAARKAQQSIANSLSSAGTSSVSSVSSMHSDASSSITSDPERSIVRIPTIITPTNSANQYFLRKSINRPDRPIYLEVPNIRQLTKLSANSGRRSKVTTNGGMQISTIQRIRCYGSDLEDFDNISLSSFHEPVSAKNYPKHCNGTSCSSAIDDCVTDNLDCDSRVVHTSPADANDSAISDDITGEDDIDNDDVNINESAVKEQENSPAKSVESPQTQETAFDSVALNHVIRLDDDIFVSNSENENQIRILKL